MLSLVEGFTCEHCGSHLADKDQSVVITKVDGKTLVRPAYRIICQCSREYFYQTSQLFVRDPSLLFRG